MTEMRVGKKTYHCVACHYQIELEAHAEHSRCAVCKGPLCPDCQTHLVRINPIVEEEESCPRTKSSV